MYLVAVVWGRVEEGKGTYSWHDVKPRLILVEKISMQQADSKSDLSLSSDSHLQDHTSQSVAYLRFEITGANKKKLPVFLIDRFLWTVSYTPFLINQYIV